MRLYTLFIGPPEKDAEWSDRGVEGAYRFITRVWRLVEKAAEKEGQTADMPVALERKMHQTIKKVTEDIDREFHFNTAISAVMELVNAIYNEIGKDGKIGPFAGKAVKTAVILLSPFIPHIAEEMWEMLGNKPSVFKLEWPRYDEGLIKEKRNVIPIQINGRLRSKIEVDADIQEEVLKKAVLADEKVGKWVGGKPVKKFIIVPERLVNIII